MSESFLDEGLDEVLGADPAPQPEPAPPPEPPPEPAPAPSPEPAPQPSPEPAAAAPPAPEPSSPPPGYVPLAAQLDERDRRQAAERRAEAAERQLQQRQPPAEAPLIPDPVADPEGWDAHQRQQAENIRWQAVTSVSQMMAEQTYGPDAVKAATEAFKAEVAAKPWLKDELRQQQHPYDYVVQRLKQAEITSKFAGVDPSEYERFVAWKALGGAPPTNPLAAAPAAIPPTPAPVAPPQSLVSSPSAGGMAADVVEEPFGSEFKRKK